MPVRILESMRDLCKEAVARLRKETAEGDRVVYRDYRNVEGVAVPESIELTNSRDDTVRIVFEEPEVNRPVEETALSPHLEGIKVLPFTEFHGF